MSAVIQTTTILRPMCVEDLPAIIGIERAAYEYPWTEGIFRDCLRVSYACSVIEEHGVIEGYGVMSVAAGESHILNVCVRPQSQRQGYGARLIEHLIDTARRQGASIVLLEVRPSNQGAVQLYHNLGFNEVGTRRAYYPACNGREDALIMALSF